MPTLLLAEHRDLVRAGLKVLLPGRFHVVGEALHGAEALAKASQARPDALIIADDLPDTSLADVVRSVRLALPDVSIIVLVDKPDSKSTRKLRGLSVSCLAREASAATIVSVIDGLVDPPDGLPVVQSKDGAGKPGPLRGNALSPTQLRVALLVVEGHRTREIAGILGVTERTVGAHRAEVMKRLNVKTSAAIAHALIARNLTQANLPSSQGREKSGGSESLKS